MALNDGEKIKIAREYFVRADQGRPDVLELFNSDAEIYFPKFGIGSGRESFLEIVKGFEGILEHIQHDYDGFNFIPSGDCLSTNHVEAKALFLASLQVGIPTQSDKERFHE